MINDQDIMLYAKHNHNDNQQTHEQTSNFIILRFNTVYHHYTHYTKFTFNPNSAPLNIGTLKRYNTGLWWWTAYPRQNRAKWHYVVIIISLICSTSESQYNVYCQCNGIDGKWKLQWNGSINYEYRDMYKLYINSNHVYWRICTKNMLHKRYYGVCSGYYTNAYLDEFL